MHENVHKSIMFPLIICILLIASGCEDSASNQVDQPDAGTTEIHQTEMNPSQELAAKMTKVDETAFVLKVTSSKPSRTWGGAVSYSQEYIQSNGDFGVVETGQCDDGPSYIMYNSSQKQIAGIGCARGPYSTTGWKRPEKNFEDANLDNRQDVISGAICIVFGLPDIDWTLRDLADVKKESEDIFSFKRKDWEEDRYYLEFTGPEGLPSKLYIKKPAYGANPEEITPVLDFEYSEINNVPPSTFDLPSDLQVSDEAVPNYIRSGGLVEDVCPDWSHLGRFCHVNG